MKVSIRTKLLGAAFTIVVVLSLANVVFFIMHLFVVESYKSISDNMISEYRLMQATDDLINSYNARFRDIDTGNMDPEKEILANKAEITSLEKYLDKTIVNSDSQTSYVGLKNTIQNVVSEIDSGLISLTESDLENAASHYDAANTKSIYVKENGNALILNELKYVNTIQSRIAYFYKLSIIVGVTVFLILVTGCILYIISFANKFIFPLQKLSDVAEKISAGDMNVAIDDNLLKLQDEIGSLSRSYNLMISKLVENIGKLTAASTDLSSKNSELERMNKFMVGRELKMVELKKLNTSLENKLANR